MKKLQSIIIAIIIGLAIAVIAIAFTGPGSNQPPTGDPAFWRKSGSDVYYNVSGGNVGIGTTNPIRPLHINSAGGAEFIMEAGDGLANWRKWNFYVAGGAGAKQNLHARILNDAGTASTLDAMTWLNNGNVGIGTAGPDSLLTIVPPATTEDVSVLHLTKPGTANFAIFYSVLAYSPNAAAAAMKIGSNSVSGRSINAGGTINASGADYAERVPWQGKKPEIGTIIEYKGTPMVVSSAHTAAFIGNDVFNEDNSILLAFIGQVGVWVKGTVTKGDFIVSNGDGTGTAVSPETITFQQYIKAIGTAWETNELEQVKMINVAVGVK